jgi:hypothetical protein
VILSLGIGEAIVTVMDERGAPTPVAWTRLRAPESLMGAADTAAMEQAVKASPLNAKYAEAIDRESAREKLAAKLEAGAAKAKAEQQAKDQAKEQETTEDKLRKEADRATRTRSPRRSTRQDKSVVEEVLTSTTARQLGRTAVREIFRGLFKTGRR